jgi:hypothetical protein
VLLRLHKDNSTNDLKDWSVLKTGNRIGSVKCERVATGGPIGRQNQVPDYDKKCHKLGISSVIGKVDIDRLFTSYKMALISLCI